MFKPILQSEEEITDFIIEYAGQPVDEDLILEYFQGCKAIMKTVPITSINQNNQEVHIGNAKTERLYASWATETMPPIIVEDGNVVDGNHRLRVARKKGVTHILIYDIIASEYETA